MRAIAQPPTREPLGASGDQRHRFLVHHVPLALVSAGVFMLWMNLPLFEMAGQHGPPQAVQHEARAAGHHGSLWPGGHQGPVGFGGHHGLAQAAGDPAMGPKGHHLMNPEELKHRRFMARATTATGYIALGLLAFTLLIGPLNLLLGRRNPVSNYLRRDAGAWTATVSVVHTIVGLQVHGAPGSFGERIVHYFFRPDGVPLTNSFGLGNWTGLAATVIALGLLAISSDFALGKLKAGRWKWLQRLNYALFVLVVAHGIFYGALLRATSPSTQLLGLCVIAVFAGQTLGIWLWRRRHARKTAAVA
jgi:methionine sulfoxide reductase heme-binding subunit